ncbi:hypothetical protein [Phaffia rhodozyma]|uniref:Uncharacterized protein n=1 Tax=Phaffia rhodozyma TaxID=264483 RepID=A0A0F7SMQ8_PHARH|nr:hypothetical protein [Phaffia rhodozyma]
MLSIASSLVLSGAIAAKMVSAQVTATGTMGVTNPATPTLGTAVNQTSVSRLASINSVDDFCLFAPAEPGGTIGDQEAEVVAWCTKPRNNARVIPDGTIYGAQFTKNDFYVQVVGFLDGTKINIMDGDAGGELDPHGATGEGNPVGGNLTSNVTGQDVNYEEWMAFMSFDQFCIRECIGQNDTISAAIMCQHELDLMGCYWIMPADYGTINGTFTECDSDVPQPPGVYPVGSPATTTSTFHQRFTITGTGTPITIGVTETPSAAYSTPSVSNCRTVSSISNGITGLVAAATASASSTSKASSSGSAVASASSAASSARASSGSVVASASTKASTAASSVSSAVSGASLRQGSAFSFQAGLLVLGAVVVGAGAVAL